MEPPELSGCTVAWPSGLLLKEVVVEASTKERASLLDTLFEDVHGHASLPSKEQSTIDGDWQRDASEVNCPPSTYGERPVQDIFSHPRFAFGSDSVFLDI